MIHHDVYLHVPPDNFGSRYMACIGGGRVPIQKGSACFCLVAMGKKSHQNIGKTFRKPKKPVKKNGFMGR